MIKIFFVGLLFFMPSLVFAGTVSSNGHKVVAVMSGYSHKGMFIETDTDLANPSSCSNWNSGSKRIIAAIPTLSEVDHVISLSLAAKFSNATLDIQVYDDVCHNGWPVLRRIKVI